MHFPFLAATAISLSLTAAIPAQADLVIQGRAAQALHCAAMLYMVSDELYNAGMITGRDLNGAQEAAVMMLAYVPGTDEQKVQAMSQRFEKLMRTRTMEQLMDEFGSTADWCEANFL